MTLRRSFQLWNGITTVACDGQCNKAWGIDDRPTYRLSGDINDFEWLADGELGNAPVDPGSRAPNGDAKPRSVGAPSEMNQWCADQCERLAKSPTGIPEHVPEPASFAKRWPNLNWRRTS